MPNQSELQNNLIKLEDCCSFNPRASKDSLSKECSFIPMSAVSENGLVDLSNSLSAQDPKKGFSYFENGDVLFAKITPCMENGKGAIVDNLLIGNIEFSKEQFKSKNDIIRKFALILLRDIMKDRHSMVKKYFSDVLNAEEENQIKEIFSRQEAQPDDDINTSVDQTNQLIKAIKEGLKYPSLNNEERADYNEVLDFLNKLNKIFKWEIYEEDLSNENQLRWYATLLCQWIEGKGLQNLTNSAITNARGRMYGPYPRKVRENGKLKFYDDTDLHKNLVIGDTLQAIESVILFSFANYFLKFSECYKKIHNLKEMQNDWYEYVEYGTTNPLSIMLQKYGFSRETALYIKQNNTEYVKYVNSEVKLKKTILENTKESIKNEIQEIMYNAPELFID